jgi:hypothetical protein
MAIEYRKAIVHQEVGDWEEETEVLVPAFDEGAKQESSGISGQRHLRYIREYKKPMYCELQVEGKLYDYLVRVDREANGMLDRLISQMKERDGVTEQLKADDQMEWVRRMNNIRNRAEEVVNHELIFA